MPSSRQDIGAQTLAALLRVPKGTEIVKCKNPLSTLHTPPIAKLTYLRVLPLVMLSLSL